MQVSGHTRKRVKKDGSVSYQIIIELPPDNVTGKRQRVYKTHNGTKKEAEKIMRQMMDDIENQTYIKSNRITVASWVDEWMGLYLKDLSPTTLGGYRYQVDNYIKPLSIGKKQLQDLLRKDQLQRRNI